MFKKTGSAGTRTLERGSSSRQRVEDFLTAFPALGDYKNNNVFPTGKSLQLTRIPLGVHDAKAYSLNHVRPNPQTGEDEEASEIMFFEYTEPGSKQRVFLPHLKVVHRYPSAFPNRIRIDRGAIRFVLSGATLMVPGLTSPGGRLPGEACKDGEGKEAEFRYGDEDLPAGTVVVVEAEAKDHACMVGRLKMGTKEMKEQKKGVAIDMGHYVGDWLWMLELDPKAK